MKLTHYKVTFSYTKNGQSTQETRDYHVSGERDLKLQISVYLEAAERMGIQVTGVEKEIVE